MAQHSLTTKLFLCIEDGSEVVLGLTVSYDFSPGYPATHDEPGASDSVEINKIRITDCGAEVLDIGAWFTRLVEFDGELATSLVASAREERVDAKADAAERRAELARDDRMMGVR